MDTKFCRDCGRHRAASEFSKNRRSRDGLAFYCREHLAERSARSREARRVEPRRSRFAPPGITVPADHKWCPDCGVVKPFDAFPRTSASRTGRATYCLPCHNERGRISRDKAGGARTYHLTRRYGISAAEADLMLEAQGGVCAICRAVPAAHVDHDHATGEVRALLCFNCDGGLGQFRDDPFLLHVAAFYVEHHNDGKLWQGSGTRRPRYTRGPAGRVSRR
ncbi:endonuclease [Blastococcus sp. CT_GayMR19]|nr:endonuclease [Blastococcus sp. CT_GayMR19]